MSKVLSVVDSKGDEHIFVNDDRHDYIHRYGSDKDGNPTNEHELQIIDCMSEGSNRDTAVFFHPRYMKIWWE